MRFLLPGELDSEGMPKRPLSLTWLKDANDDQSGAWLAEYPSLPGYYAVGDTQSAALFWLTRQMRQHPVCQVEKVKPPLSDKMRKMYLAIQKAGGPWAKTEVIKTEAKGLKTGQSEPLRLARNIREFDKRMRAHADSINVEHQSPQFDDADIDVIIDAIFVDNPFSRHRFAMLRIRDYLKKHMKRNKRKADAAKGIRQYRRVCRSHGHAP